MSSPIKLPEVITLEWVSQVRETLYESSKHGVTALKAVLPKDVAIALLARTERLLDKEPPLLEVCGAGCLGFNAYVTLLIAYKHACARLLFMGTLPPAGCAPFRGNFHHSCR